MIIIEKINNLRKENGMSINQLEKECGLTRQIIEKWNTSIPRVNALIKIADYFNVSLDYLVGREATQTIEQNTTLSPLLSRFEKLDDVQKEKALSYIDGLLGANTKTEKLMKSN